MDKQILELLQKMDSRMDRIESVLDEHGRILRALEERTKVDSARLENIEHKTAKIEGDIAGLRKDLSNVEVITATNWADIARLKAAK